MIMAMNIKDQMSDRADTSGLRASLLLERDGDVAFTEQLKKGYDDVLGCIDLTTVEARLSVCQDRSAATTTECMLHEIILRKEEWVFITHTNEGG